jgi:hypothetical protein
MAATSAAPARQAVIDALTTVTGQPKGLPIASLFRRAAWSPVTSRAIAAKASKRCLVLFTQWADDGESTLPSPIITTNFVVQVVCEYAAGSDLFTAEDDRAQATILADAVLVPAALCEPGALQAEAASDLALAGGALRRDGYRATVTPPRGDKSRLYTVTHVFPNVTIDITQPT